MGDLNSKRSKTLTTRINVLSIEITYLCVHVSSERRAFFIRILGMLVIELSKELCEVNFYEPYFTDDKTEV